MAVLKTSALLLSSLLFLGCGSQTLEDEGLESKTIEEAASTSTGSTGSGGTSSTEFTVVSTTPADGATNVSTNTQISLTFSDDLGLYGAGTSTTCSEQVFQLSTDNFSSCIGWDYSSGYFYTVNGSTITLETPTLSASTTYQLKVVPSASSGQLTLTSLSSIPVTSSTISFTTQ